MIKDKRKIIPFEIYTDGSCMKSGSTTYGAWAYYIIRDNKIIIYDSDSIYDTTNQRMELLAAVESLKRIDLIREKYDKIILYSDSAYLINCVNKGWYKTWMRNGWVNSQNKPVANQDLWWQLIPYFDMISIDFKKVKGHDTSFFNNLCDELAQKTALELKMKRR